MKNLLFMAAIALGGCARNPPHTLAPLVQDESIVFPKSFGVTPSVGQPGKAYALDGVTLQALLIATQDLLPAPTKSTPCWDRHDAYVYQVLRDGDVIFIEIHPKPAACDGGFLMLDSGWKYAISMDGRILRRLQEGEPEWPAATSEPSDAGVGEGKRTLDVSGAVELHQGAAEPMLPWRRPDGGPEAGSAAPPHFPVADGGVSGDGGARGVQ